MDQSIINSNHLTRLREKYFSVDDVSVVPFLGAGTSVLNGIPEWSSLVDGYYKEMNCTFDLAEEKKKCGNDLPTITELIFRDSGGNLKSYHDYLEKSVTPKETDTHGLPLHIVKGFKQIITTNFDNTLDSTFSILDKKTKNLIYPEINAVDFTDSVVAYLHGKISAKQFIFRKEEYDHAYNDAQITTIKDFLRSIIKRKVLLFIGFSFKDKELKNTLKQVIEEVRYSAEKFEKTYGRIISQTKIQGLYVIVHEKNLMTEISRTTIERFGISIDEKFKMYFTELETYQFQFMNNISLTDLRNILELENTKDSTDNFIQEISKIEDNRINLKYFEDLGFNILSYKGDRIEVINLIKQIFEESEFTESVSDASTINT